MLVRELIQGLDPPVELANPAHATLRVCDTIATLELAKDMTGNQSALLGAQ